MDNKKTPKDIYYDLCDKYIETMDRGDIVEMAMLEYAEQQVKLFAIHVPSELDPVLAKIEHINSLGKSTWYEVVYFDRNWRCYNGSSTFKDGEKVVKWRYCKECL